MTPKASGSRPFPSSQPLDFLEGFVCRFVFSSQHEACELLVPRPGTEPLPLSPELGVLTTGLPAKSLFWSVLFLCPTSLKLSREPESRLQLHGARGGSPMRRCCWGPRPLPPGSPLFQTPGPRPCCPGESKVVLFPNPSVSRVVGFHCLLTDNFPVCLCFQVVTVPNYYKSSGLRQRK